MIPTDYDNAERRFAGVMIICLLVFVCLLAVTGGKCVTATILLPALKVAL